MILHVVLYRPKATVSDADRRAFLEALTAARDAIASIRHFWIGRRMADGPPYVLSGFPDLPFAAVAAFDDRRGLLEYLGHPAHTRVSELFNSAAESALIYDFEVVDAADDGGEAARRLLDPGVR